MKNSRLRLWLAVGLGVVAAGVTAWRILRTPPCNGRVAITLQSNGPDAAHPDPCRASRGNTIKFQITNGQPARHVSIDDSGNRFLAGLCKSPEPIANGQTLTKECQIMGVSDGHYQYQAVDVVSGKKGDDPEIEVQGGPGGDDDLRGRGSSPSPGARVSPAP